MADSYCKTTVPAKLTVQTASDVMAFLATQKAKAAKDRANTPGKWAFVPCLNCVVAASKGTARPECHLNYGGPGCWECRLAGEDCIALPGVVDNDGCELINMIRLRINLPKEFEEVRQNLCTALHLGEEMDMGGEGAVTTGTPTVATPVAGPPIATTPIAVSPVNDKKFSDTKKVDQDTKETEENTTNVNNGNAQDVASHPAALVNGEAGREEFDDMSELLDCSEEEVTATLTEEQAKELDQEAVSVEVVDSVDAHDDTLRSTTPFDTPGNAKEGDGKLKNLSRLIDIPKEQMKWVVVESVGMETKEDQKGAKFEIGATSYITAKLDVNKEGVDEFKDMPALIYAPVENSEDGIDTPASSVSGDVEGN